MLLTSDQPVALWRKRDAFGDDGAIGFETADEISFPIDSRRALLLLRRNDVPECRLKRREDQARELNRRTAVGALRLIFHRPDLAPMEDLPLPPPRPMLSTVGVGEPLPPPLRAELERMGKLVRGR